MKLTTEEDLIFIKAIFENLQNKEEEKSRITEQLEETELPLTKMKKHGAGKRNTRGGERSGP